MRKVIAVVFLFEFWIALHMATSGEWWAARAARRYGKFSGTGSDALKSWGRDR